MATFNNAAGQYNPELSSFWLKTAAIEIGNRSNGQLSDLEFHTYVAEYANLYRVEEVLESLGWKSRGASNVSMSAYFERDLGEGDSSDLDYEERMFEVRVSDHDDFHPAGDDVVRRYQVNFRTETAQWSDVDVGPGLSTEEVRQRLEAVLTGEA